jgi:translocation and assembly module TamB
MTFLRWLIRTLISLTVFFMLMITLLLTPIGFRFSIFLLQQSLPGQLSYQNLKGMLFGPIQADHILYKHESRIISIENLRFNWRPSRLFRRQLKITELRANNVVIQLPEAKSKKTNFSITNALYNLQNLKPIKPVKLHFPLTLIIQQAHIQHITYRHPNQVPLIKAPHTMADLVITNQNIHAQIHTKLTAPQTATLDINAAGNLQHYTFTIKGETQKNKINLSGSGDQDSLIATLDKSQLLTGTMAAKIQFHWYPKIYWKANINAQHINLAPLLPQFPKTINTQIQTQGHIVGSDPHFTLKSKLTTDTSHLNINMAHHKQWVAKWDIKIPEIQQLYTEASGKLFTQGKLHGDLNSPQSSGSITGQDLHWSAINLQSISGHWNLNFDGHTQSAIKIALTKLHFKDTLLEQAQANLTGTNKNHTLTIKTKSNQNKLSFRLHGHYIKHNWTGTVTQFSSNAGILGTWHLKTPTRFMVSNKQRYLKPLCLIKNSRAYLCTEANWQTNKPWHLSAKGKNINFKKAQEELNLSTKITSTLSINADIKGQQKQITHAQIHAALTPGNVNYRFKGRRISTAIRPSHINLNIDPKNGLTLESIIQLAEADALKANIKLPQFNQKNTQNIAGQISINAHDFRIVSLFEPDIRIAPGHLAGELKLNGNLKSPNLNGQLKLTTPHFEYRMLQANAKNIHATIQAKKQKLLYKLKAQAYNKGSVMLNGYSDIANGFDTKFTLKTNNAQIIKNQNYDIITTAKILFIFAHHGFSLTGDIHIPQATLKPTTVSDTLTMPHHIVTYIGKANEKQVSKSARPRHIDLHITLGNQVKMQAYGIDARLSGNLNLNMAHNTSAMGNGKINIEEGTFAAYGQNLQFMPGSSISFVRSPLDNPFIDARAFKAIRSNAATIANSVGRNKINVGVHVQGTLRNMHFNLFSQPGGLSQADILSYLILGYSSNNASGANMALLLEAANSLEGSNNGLTAPITITNKLRKSLGIDEIGVRSQSTTDAIGNTVDSQSAFVVGERLSKNLYLEFSHGLLIPSNIFKLQYRFNDRWMIQTSTGSGVNVGTGIDVLYTIATH